jgi:hypothetical protein
MSDAETQAVNAWNRAAMGFADPLFNRISKAGAARTYIEHIMPLMPVVVEKVRRERASKSPQITAKQAKNMGREVKAAERAGMDRRVNELIDEYEKITRSLSYEKGKAIHSAFNDGRFG